MRKFSVLTVCGQKRKLDLGLSVKTVMVMLAIRQNSVIECEKFYKVLKGPNLLHNNASAKYHEANISTGELL